MVAEIAIVLLALICVNGFHANLSPYQLPVVPLSSTILQGNESLGSDRHRRAIWIVDRKNAAKIHAFQFKSSLELCKLCVLTVCDDACRANFFNTTFRGTSTAWAYSIIRDAAFQDSKIDLWKYAVMYTYGGLLLDYDFVKGLNISEILNEPGSLLLSEENRPDAHDCYISTYHLSDSYTYQQYKHSFPAAKHYTGVDRDQQPQFFHGNTILNWAMFAAPRHPVYLRALQNIVEIITSMYQRESVVHITRLDDKQRIVHCVTGGILGPTIRELELEGRLDPKLIPRIVSNSFSEFGASLPPKQPDAAAGKLMKHRVPPFLSDSADLNMTQLLTYLEGKVVNSDISARPMLILNGTKRFFPDHHTFLQMGFKDRHIKFISNDILQRIPDGDLIGRSEWDSQHANRTAAHAALLAKRQEFALALLRNASTELRATSPQQKCDSDHHVILQIHHGAPIIQHPLCLGMRNLGTSLTAYLNAVACADLTGAHFIVTHKMLGLAMEQLLVTHPPPNPLPEKDFVGTVHMNQDKNLSDPTLRDPRYAFYNNLPDLIPNVHARTAEQVAADVQRQCKYPWSDARAPWLQRVPLIGQVLRPAIDAYVNASDAERTGTVLNHEVDRTTALYSDFLPLIPNVTIQYRCGDNINSNTDDPRYGLLPFAAFKAPRIPRDVAKYIYIIADAPERVPKHPYSERCGHILNKLYAFLTIEFPQATLVLKRGGDLFLDYARIAYSNVVVCSASTFCLWPALANQHGQVHFPLSPLIAAQSAPRLATNFHWIRDQKLVSKNTHVPWDLIIDKELWVTK